MCGIAGIVRFDDRPIETRRLYAMLEHLRHRGPDGNGISEHQRCALVHTRLAVIDPPGGSQPMHLPKINNVGPLHLVFNGEIYNHRELRRTLEQRGHRFFSDHCDTEVILVGFREWGSELPKRLSGMFAFAIWDESQKQLFLARDRMGKKPLYFRKEHNELIFASLVATIVKSDRLDNRPRSTTINQAALQTYLRLGYPFQQSMIEGIVELPHAHWIAFDRYGREKCESYWQPPPVSLANTTIDATQVLDEILNEAVTRRLDADVPLGCFLSGGIDSSLIAAIAQKQLADYGPRLKTFSVAMPAAQYDESEYARSVADHIGAEHITLETNPGQAVDDLLQLMAVSGEPTADSSILPTYWLCKATRQHVAVALSGDGGDELFGGYDRYRAIRILNKHAWWLKHLPQRSLDSTNQKSRRTRLKRLIQAARCGNCSATRYHHMIHLFTSKQLSLLGLNCDPLTAREPHLTPLPHWQDHGNDDIHAAMQWDRNHYLPFDLLRKLDRASMAVALEVRCPMLDSQICDLAAHWPVSVLMPRNQQKGLLRKVAAQYLPRSIVNRPKQGFAIPIGLWFRSTLKDQLVDLLNHDYLQDFGIRNHGVRTLIDQHITGQFDHTHRLFALLQLAVWMQWLKGI